ncbi:MAG: branched-chain amino acid ABC transporter permease [Candidatus Dormibacteraceae bacterium]
MITYVVGVITVGFISSVLVLGLNVRWGWAGEFDLAYYAFVAIGAYVAGVLIGGPSAGIVPPPDGWILGLHWPFLLAVPVAMLVSGIISLGLGAVALRKLRGDYFAITTVAFTYITIAFFSQEFQLFNGFNGVYNVPQPFSVALSNLSVDQYGFFFMFLCLAILLVVYWVMTLFYRSPFGLTLRAIREDEQAAAAFGRGVYMYKLKAYFLGGLVAGLGGALYVVYLTSWDPSAWSAFETFLLFAAIFIGGQANTRGVILGAFIIVAVIPELTRFLPNVPGHPDLFSAIRNIVIGILILLVLRFRPMGIIPEPRPRDARIEVGEGRGAEISTHA